MKARLWTSARIDSYTLTFLDTDDEWSPPSERTFLTDDRETAFQRSRRHGGLLIRADSLGGAAALARYRAHYEKALAAATENLENIERQDIAAPPDGDHRIRRIDVNDIDADDIAEADGSLLRLTGGGRPANNDTAR